ncbi:SIS domain-containing protein [Alicyclobacillus dauci]|uniref:SIS domain-containing protein n=1 Tax=Alicyclobacillus dauci TaxID=1475485 RepID=A0ABY6YZH6_9BACL|nr:SIS domain-containing protein [Alicyclobacillus dauci]WAH36027.1 SIS domain-containing protein [Alicyclobacillus dauci]
MISAEAFLQAALDAVEQVRETQWTQIHEAAKRLADVIAAGGVVHAFGTGHSKAFAMELCNRAGGLVPMHMMSIDDLWARGERVDDMNDPSIERDPDVAHRLLELYDIRPEDGVIIVSNSGRNGALVEMALQMKARGHTVICVTSLSHSTQVSSRHASGQRLFEVADVVIDNCGPLGDALLESSALPAKVCSISSVTGAIIAQCLTAEITRNLMEMNVDVPVLMSANLDGADEFNETMTARYKGRI